MERENGELKDDDVGKKLRRSKGMRKRKSRNRRKKRTGKRM